MSEYAIKGTVLPKALDVSLVTTGALAGGWAVHLAKDGTASVREGLLLTPHIALFAETTALEAIWNGESTWRDELGAGNLRATGDMDALGLVVEVLFP